MPDPAASENMFRIPSRILVPLLGAAICAGILLGFLWWQLARTHHLLLPEPGDSSASAMTQLPSELQPEETGTDGALTALRKGDILALQGDWAAATEEYRRSADQGGGLTALRKLAQAQLQQRDIEAARDTAERMRKAGARGEDLLLLESIIQLRLGELHEAKARLTAAADSPQKHYGLALLAIIEGNHEQAKRELADVIGGWEPVLRAHARTLQTAYEEYALFPDSPAIHLTTLLGRALAQVQECELALPLLAQVTQVQSDYRDAWMVKGFCELTTARAQEALMSFEQAYAIDPEKPEIQYFLARAYAVQGDHGSALTYAQYALENGFEPEADARRLIAKEAIALGNIDAAIEQYEVLLTSPDVTLDTYAEFVALAITAEKKEVAYLKSREAAEKWPTNARAHDLLGWAALETNRNDEARTALDRALELDPSLTSAKERRAEL